MSEHDPPAGESPSTGFRYPFTASEMARLVKFRDALDAGCVGRVLGTARSRRSVPEEAAIDDQQGEWAHRRRIVREELAAHRQEVLDLGRELLASAAPADWTSEYVPDAVRARILYLRHREDQLEAECLRAERDAT
jgi:hypothetical protein